MAILDFFLAALQSTIPHFREQLLNNSCVNLLNLTRKVNNKHETICRVVDLILNNYC